MRLRRCGILVFAVGLVSACRAESSGNGEALPGPRAVQGFAGAHPTSNRLLSADGQRLVHASGFLAATGARRPEDAAAAFLSPDAHGAAFGVTASQTLTVKAAPTLGEVGSVRFERTIDGLPVLGGDLVVGVDAQNRVFVVNGGDVAPTVSGHHALGEAAAHTAALSSFADGVRGAGPPSVAVGWRAFGPSVRAVYRVDFVAEEPAGDWRVFVDGETGKALFRENLRYYASAPGSVFEVSPVETAASPCSMSGTGHSSCASPVAATFQNLSTGSDLSGTQTSVYNCKGANAPASAAGVPGSCTPVAAVGGAFNFTVDPTYQSTADDFAAAMAYYHLDKHVSFFKGLDPTPPSGSGRAVRASLPALVNVSGGAPSSCGPGPGCANAFFSGLLDAMVFGQGLRADYAYDATVMYHEFTHGAVSAWGGFNPSIDSLGGLAEPRAVNEGTADAMAVSENGRSLVGSFLGATSAPATAFLRDMNDPNASRTCQGDGTLVTKLGVTGINGLDGEVHDDGEIWNGFYWEVYQGLKTAAIKACSGACEAGPALQYKALQLAAGTSPTLNSYWQTMKSAATALFPSQSGVAAYVDCVAKRRRLDKCDRTVPVYGGESKVQYIDQRFSPFQMVLPTTGPAQFNICSAQGTATTIYVRNGLPVQINPATLAVTASDGSVSFTQLCSGGSAPFTITSAGTWYLLLDSPNALVGATPGNDIFTIGVGFAGMALRPISTIPPVCGMLSITPASPVISPKGWVPLVASGGSGPGFTWTLATNNSGGSIDSFSGFYVAGPTGNVTDVVQVADSLGSTVTRSVTVSAGVSISPATASTSPKGSVAFSASGGSGSGFTWSLATNNSGASINAATGAYTAGSIGSVTDVVEVTDSLGNTVTRSVTVSAGVSISPATASASPEGSVAFSASGGSGSGFTWSLATNNSGASIDTATGAYTAGSIGSVSDVVQVTDSLGDTATRAVAVTASPPSGSGSGGGKSGGCGTSGGADASILALGLAALLCRWRKNAPQSN
jgi:Zn-dependent metalloprotease